MYKSESISRPEILNHYQDRNTGFDEMLYERTKNEIAYDNLILEELRKATAIRKALEIAGKKYPDEALQYSDDNIEDIHSHYDYLLNHEIIKNRIEQITH